MHSARDRCAMAAVVCWGWPRQNVALCLLGFIFFASARRNVSEVHFSKKWIGYNSTCGVGGLMGVEAAAGPGGPDEQQDASDGTEHVEGASAGSPESESEREWTILYLKVVSTYLPLLFFARERYLANSNTEDHDVLQQLYSRCSFEKAVEFVKTVSVPRVSVADAASSMNEVLTQMEKVVNDFIRDPQRRRGAEQELIKDTQLLLDRSNSYLKSLLHLMTCSHRFSQSRRAFLAGVQVGLPAVIKFVLMFLRMVTFLKFCVEPTDPAGRLYQNFIASSQQIGVAVQNFATHLHGVSVSCLFGLSHSSRTQYTSAMESYIDGEPYLKAFSPLLRTPSETSHHAALRGTPQQTGCSRDEDPRIDSTAYVKVIVEHFRELQLLDASCHGRLSMHVGDRAVVVTREAQDTAANQMASSVPVGEIINALARGGLQLPASPQGLSVNTLGSLRTFVVLDPSSDSSEASGEHRVITKLVEDIQKYRVSEPAESSTSTSSASTGRAGSSREGGHSVTSTSAAAASLSASRASRRPRSPCLRCRAVRGEVGRIEGATHQEEGPPEARGITQTSSTAGVASSTVGAADAHGARLPSGGATGAPGAAADAPSTSPSVASGHRRESRKKGKRKT